MQLSKYFADARTYFVLFGVLVVGALLLSEFLTQRLNLYDFRVMYSAAEAYLSGEQVYGIPFGLKTGFYKYSPFTILVFMAYTPLDYPMACVVHFLIIGCAVIGVILSLEKLIRQYTTPVRGRTFLLLLAVFLSVFIHLFRDLHLGNINIILVCLLTMALAAAVSGRYYRAGFLLAFVILAKPYFLVVMLAFVAFGYWKTVASTAGWVSIFILLTVVVMGPSESFSLHKQWVAAMMAHGDYLGSPHTISSLLFFYLGLEMSGKFAFFFLPVVAIGITYFSWRINRQFSFVDTEEATAAKSQGLIFNFYLLMAIIPSILITDTEHFLFSLPLIALLCFHRPKAHVGWTIMLVVVLLLFGGNSSDMLGMDLSRQVNRWGLLGISNLCVLGMIIYQFWGRKNRKAIP